MGDDIYTSAVEKMGRDGLTAIELLDVAQRLQAKGQGQAALDLYRTWIDHNPQDPVLYAVYFNFGVSLSQADDLGAARAALEQAIRIKPDFIPPYINLGYVSERMGDTPNAVARWYDVLDQLSLINGQALAYKVSAFEQLGRVLEGAYLYSKAEEILKQSLEINPHQPKVIQHWVNLRQRQCKWPVIKPWGPMTRDMLLEAISPISLAAHSDDPLFQLANAAAYNRYNIGKIKSAEIELVVDEQVTAKSGRLRIGYLSSDLREHAVGFLTAEVYELHDRSKIELFLYYCGIPSSDSYHERIKSAADHWVDISTMSDSDALRRMKDDGIQILIDLNGYTNGSRDRLIALRPAPIIVNWLGYPGTTGSRYHNYIIADDFIIPRDSEIFYSEKVMRLPCYQPNDRQRKVSAATPSREDFGLPAEAMVYCCFNEPYKITQFTWLRWMEILRQVPGSVLWLLEWVEENKIHFRELAQECDIDPNRLIFAPRQHHPEHLARYPLADLFLDTPPYGAHTTASDALWMGVPIVTFPGRSFASRVCGSLLTSSGLEELVCDSMGRYVDLAIALGRDREKLASYRRQLRDNRSSSVLFDTPSLVTHLEVLYADMWHDYQTGRLPLPDLTNLDIYREIGIELDQNDRELLTFPGYQELYEQELRARDRYCRLKPDGRLWTGRA